MEAPKAISPDALDALVDKGNMSYEQAATFLGISLGGEEQLALVSAQALQDEVEQQGDSEDAPEIAEGLPGYFVEGIPYKTLLEIAEQLRKSARLSAESKKRGAGKVSRQALTGQSIALRAQSDSAILLLVRTSDYVPLARIYLREAFGEKNMPHHHAA